MQHTTHIAIISFRINIHHIHSTLHRFQSICSSLIFPIFVIFRRFALCILPAASSIATQRAQALFGFDRGFPSTSLPFSTLPPSVIPLILSSYDMPGNLLYPWSTPTDLHLIRNNPLHPKLFSHPMTHHLYCHSPQLVMTLHAHYVSLLICRSLRFFHAAHYAFLQLVLLRFHSLLFPFSVSLLPALFVGYPSDSFPSFTANGVDVEKIGSWCLLFRLVFLPPCWFPI